MLLLDRGDFDLLLLASSWASMLFRSYPVVRHKIVVAEEDPVVALDDAVVVVGRHNRRHTAVEVEVPSQKLAFRHDIFILQWYNVHTWL